MDGRLTSAKRSTDNRIVGLDSLRFCAALAVAVSHMASNAQVAPGSAAGLALWRIVAVLANGPAAVALFFAISGFCIHLGQVRSLTVETPIFLARRILRIGLPLLAVLLLAHSLGGWATTALETILWSIYCELFYYLAYPLFLAARRRCAMNMLFLICAAVSVLLVSSLERVDHIWQYGVATAGICFPLWVAGAWLAERHSAVQRPPAHSILGWRFAALLTSAAANLANDLHSMVSSPPLIYAAVGTFCWFYIPCELARWRIVPPLAIVERLGRASYSLYLVHILPIALMLQFTIPGPFGVAIVLQTLAIGLVASSFFTLCELPAHRLARRIGRKRLPIAAVVAEAATF